MISALSTHLRTILITSANQVLLSGGAAAIIVVFSNLLERETFGSFRFLAAILAVLSFFSLPGMGTLFLTDTPLTHRRTVRQAVRAQMRWGLGAMVGATIIGILILLQGNTDLGQAFIAGGILAPLANLYTVPGQIFAGLHRFTAKLVVDGILMVSLVVAAVLGPFLFSSLAGITITYYSLQAGATLAALTYTFYALPPTARCTHEERAPFAENNARLLTFFHLPFFILPALEKALVYLLLGPVSLALFIVASLPFDHVKNAYRNLLNYLILPHLQDTPAEHPLKRWFIVSTMVSILAGGLLATLIHLLFPILFPYYPEAQSLALILTLGVLFLPFHTIPLSFIANKQLPPLVLFGGALLVIDTLIIGAVALPFGVSGIVKGKILFELISGILLLFLYTNQTPPVQAVHAR